MVRVEVQGFEGLVVEGMQQLLRRKQASSPPCSHWSPCPGLSTGDASGGAGRAAAMPTAQAGVPCSEVLQLSPLEGRDPSQGGCSLCTGHSCEQPQEALHGGLHRQ